MAHSPRSPLAPASILGSLALLFSLCHASLARATTITVDTTTPGAAADGKCSLGEAIQAANTDSAVDTCAAGLGADEIHVAAATYEFLQAFDSSDAQTALPAVSTKMTIVGATADTSILTMNAVATTLRFFRLTGTGNLTLRHLTLTKSSQNGGAVQLPLNGGTITLDDCTVSRCGGTNQASVITGGDAGSTVTITGSRFTGNTGISLQLYGTATIDGTSFVANALTPVVSSGGDLTITGSTFDQNTLTSQNVSAVRVLSSSAAVGKARIVGSKFTSNVSDNGPALENDHTVLTVTDCMFSANDGGTSDAAGAIGVQGATTVEGTLIEGNKGGNGAAIRSQDLTGSEALVVRNSTITGNRGSGSGAIFTNSTGDVTLNNVTIAGNTTKGSGGGIAIPATGGIGVFRVANTIVAGNTDGGGKNDCSTGNGKFLTSGGYNLIGTGAGCSVVKDSGDQIGTAQKPIDPKLGALADNGGPTETLGLMPGSPALDHGSPGADAGTACEATDQTGKSRPVGTTCDIGAFEGTIAVPDSGTGGPGAGGRHGAVDAGEVDATLPGAGGSASPDAGVSRSAGGKPASSGAGGAAGSPGSGGKAAAGAPPSLHDAGRASDAASGSSSGDSGGCGCRVGGDQRRPGALAILALGAAVLVSRRSRRVARRHPRV